MIFIYRDPRIAFLSMRHRGSKLLQTNYAKINNLYDGSSYTDHAMLKSMLSMFANWTAADNVLVIEYSSLASTETKDRLAKHIGRPLSTALKWKEPKVHNGDMHVRRMFEKEKCAINNVLNYSK